MTTLACPVATAMRMIDVKFPESVFYRAALEVGYGRRAEDQARQLFQQWNDGKGWSRLPSWCKDRIMKLTTATVKAK
jgi:hypothetical protein